MGTYPDTMQSPLVSLSEADVSPCGSTYRQLWGWRCSIVLPFPALRAFADGLVGSLIGGLVYCLIMAYYHPEGLQIAGLRVLALSLTFGGFEMWRVRRQRTRKSVRRRLLWTLSASMLVFWALGAAFADTSTNDFRQGTRPHFLQVRLDPIA